MLVSLMWRVRINSNFKKGGNESRDLFQDHDLCISDYDRYLVSVAVEPG